MFVPRPRADVALSEPPVSPYGYVPGMDSTVAYTVVFSLLTIVHLVLAIRYKYFSGIVTMVFGGILEIIGWAGRLWSSKNVLMWEPFIMQTCCLIIGPVFFSAWDYTLLGMCIRHLGPQYSLLGPKWYIIVFVIADIVSLVLQAIGGGGAAVQAQNYEDTDKNTRIMLAGILFQLATTAVFSLLAADFMARVVFHKPYPQRMRRMFRWKRGEEASPDGSEPIEKDDETAQPVNLRHAQYLLAGVAWATVMIYIRGIYRSIELAQGWTGYLITHEVYFVWLDGFIMVLCMAGLAVAHPGFLLPQTGWC